MPLDASSSPNPYELCDEAAYRRALAVLLDVGSSIATELKTPAPESPLPARAAAFERVAAAVRRTILLAEHLDQDAATRAAHAQAAADARIRARKIVLRTVQERIETSAKPEQAATLRRELLERINGPDLEDDLARLQPSTVIDGICRDFGLPDRYTLTPGLRRTPEDIAILCAQAAAPAGSGLPQWSAAADHVAAREHTPTPSSSSPPGRGSG